MRRIGTSGALVEWGERRYEPTLTTQSQDIPQKAETRRKWLRYFYEYDPLFGSLIDFFADFPMVGMHNEHPDEKVVQLCDDLCDDIDMDTYLSDIFFEYYLVSDVFPFVYFNPTTGELREATLLNPDDVVVERTIFSEQEMLYIKPDEGVRNLVNTRKPVELYQRLSPDQIHAVKIGKNILLNARQAAHLKRGRSRLPPQRPNGQDGQKHQEHCYRWITLRAHLLLLFLIVGLSMATIIPTPACISFLVGGGLS